MIYLLNQMHSNKLQALIGQIEKPFHVRDMIDNTMMIVHQFMANIVHKQNKLKADLEAKQND